MNVLRVLFLSSSFFFFRSYFCYEDSPWDWALFSARFPAFHIVEFQKPVNRPAETLRGRQRETRAGDPPPPKKKKKKGRFRDVGG